MTSEQDVGISASQPPRRPGRWRRLTQYRLRTLLLVMAVFGVWLGPLIYRSEAQRRAVAAIQDRRGTIRYDWECDADGFLLPSPERPGRDWLFSLVGPHYLNNVVYVSVGEEADASLLLQLRHVPKVKWLFCHWAPVSDPHLAGLPRLGGLKELSLGGTLVTDDGLARLAGLKELQILELWGAPIEGPGLVHLSELTALETLDLGFTKVSDGDLPHLQGLANLLHLDLAGTQVTDQGLAHLAGMKQLKRLNFFSTSVTPAGVARLKESLPDCKVVGVEGK